MHAVAVTQSLPITDPDVFVDVDLPVPSPGPLDLLVEIEAISLNPIDVKLRRKAGTPTNRSSWVSTPPEWYAPSVSG